MVWTLFDVPSDKKSELDAVLKEDSVSRQSQTVRDAASMGGAAGHLYVLIEGSADAVTRAEGLLAPIGTKLAGPDGESMHRRFKADEEAASAGMGLFFTED